MKLNTTLDGNSSTPDQAQDTANVYRKDYTSSIKIIFAFTIFFFLIGYVFHQSQIIGGSTYDEALDRVGVRDQLSVVSRWIAGDRTAHYSQTSYNVAYYGILIVLPAYIIERYAEVQGVENPSSVYSYALHLAAFTSYCLSIIFTYLILLNITRRRITALTGAGLLAVYPLWLGHAFFNYKDVPIAAFFLMALYATIGLLQAGQQRRRILGFAGLLALATVLIAGMKVAALGLILPSWLAALYVLVRRRHFGTLLALCAVPMIGVFAVTPIAWSDPIHYMLAAVEHMANHPWLGCTLTAGECMDPHEANWSAAHYILIWAVAQTPVLIAVGAIPGLFVALRSGLVGLTVFASAAFPLIVIIANNSTLYSGLRHLSFEIPMAFILAMIFLNKVGRRYRYSTFGTLVAIQTALFVWDDVALFPYNYVYFNIPARQVVDGSLFETDYWGFSLKEATKLPVVDSPNTVIVANPRHLFQPFLPEEAMRLTVGDIEKLPGGTQAVLISYPRKLTIPASCSDAEHVVRQLPLGGKPLRLSYATRCPAE